MTDTRQPSDERRVRSFVKQQIDAKGWGPAEAGTYALDRDLVSEFRAVIAFTRLCVDAKEPYHKAAHRNTLIRECVPIEFIDRMARKFGFSEERAKFLIDQYDQEMAAFAGLQGDGSE